MSEKTVLIDGEEYISSDRAAKLVGYTKDYVGQLARAGKIKAKRVGRSWYIAEKSINKHKLSVHYILTKPKKTRSEDSTSNSEKTNQNIVKSPITAYQNTQKPYSSNTVTKVEREIVTKPNDSVSGDEDTFLPKLKEKKRDVLLHSDFRYEQSLDKPRDFETITKPAKPIQSAEKVFDFKKVEIRKPVQPRVSLRTPSNFNQDIVRVRTEPARRVPRISSDIKPRIDGIVLPTDTRMQRPKKSSSPLASKKYDESYEYDSPIKSRHNAYKHEEESDSKAVPVIGAIVIFTLLVVVYIFTTFK